MNQLLEVLSNPSTDWILESQKLVEDYDFALWERQMGHVALDDSVRITAEDDSVRITASAVNRDF